MPAPTPLASPPRRAWILAAIGAAGLAMLMVFASLWRAVLGSPGDDNPAGMLAAAATLLSLVPSVGMVLFVTKAEAKRHRAFIIVAGIILVLLAFPAFIALGLLR